VNNNHLYPIIDTDTKKSIAISGRLTLSEYKFCINYDDIQYIDYYDNEMPNNSSKVILIKDNFEKNTILEMMTWVMQTTKSNIEYIKFYNGKPVAFRNPVTLQVYEITSFYDERKDIIDNLSIKYGNSKVKFQNQSYTQIAQIIFDNEFGNIKQLKSNLSDKIFEIFDTYKIGPYCARVSNDILETEDSNGFDICKSYSSVLLNNTIDFNIFQQFDEPKIFNTKYPLIAGEYYINKQISLCDGLMLYPNGYYPLVFVKYLLDKQAITKKDITYYIPAKQYIKADAFKTFVEHVYENYDEHDAKKIINNFIGDLGTRFIKSDKGCITSSLDIACSILLQEKGKDRTNVYIDSLNDNHFVRVQSKQPKYNTGLPIHRHIICGGIINLANLYYTLKSESTRFICFNTDSIMVKGEVSDITTLHQNYCNIREETIEVDNTVSLLDIGIKLNDDDDEFVWSDSESSTTSTIYKYDPIYDTTLKKIGKIRSEEWKVKGRDYLSTEDNEKYNFKQVEWETINEKENEFKEFYEMINAQHSA
jgi:hypothetical protein